jgi:hypothetical protein
MTKEKDDSWMFYHGVPIDFKVPEGVTGPIHCLGDSHINVLSQAFPTMFMSTRFASIAAYAVGNSEQDHEYVVDSLSRIPTGEKILCCFGEIDCRHYMPKLAIETGRTIVDLVAEATGRYTKNFLSLLSQKYNVIVVGPYVTPQDHNHCTYAEVNNGPYWSNTFAEISLAKFWFNFFLREFCTKNPEILYVPIYYISLAAGWDLAPQGTYFNDSSHLGPCMIPVILDTLKNHKDRQNEEVQKTP